VATKWNVKGKVKDKMKDDVIVDAAKVRDYLLSPAHPIGRFKVPFFGALGYSRRDWRRLRRDLVDMGQRGQVTAAAANPSDAPGTKYEVRGISKGPSGRRIEIVTIWIVAPDDKRPRLVTAYPG
jgi:hypothetical protein